MSTYIVDLILFLVGSRVPRRVTTHPQPSLTKSFIKDHQTKLLIVFIFMRFAHKNNTAYGISVLSAKLETHYSTIHNKIVD